MSTDVKTYAPGTFCWNDLNTPDQNAAKKYYTTLFGWTVQDSPVGPDMVYSMCFKDGKDVGAIAPHTSEAPTHWMNYVAVASVDETTAKAEKLGAKVLAKPMDVMDVGRMAVLMDPQGAVLALWEARKHGGAGLRNESGSACWNELMTTDIAAARKFYGELLGWTHDVMPMGGEFGDYTLFKKGDTQVGGGMNWTKSPAHWLLYFSVADCDGTVAHSEKLGGKTMAPAQDIPNVGRFAVLTDPQGGHFGILQRPKK